MTHPPVSLVLLLAICAVLQACGADRLSAGSQRAKNSDAVDLQRILVLPRPPSVVAQSGPELRTAQQIMRNLLSQDLSRREGAVYEDANALPWLTGSTEGRKFLEEQGQLLTQPSATPSATPSPTP